MINIPGEAKINSYGYRLLRAFLFLFGFEGAGRLQKESIIADFCRPSLLTGPSIFAILYLNKIALYFFQHVVTVIIFGYFYFLNCVADECNGTPFGSNLPMSAA